MESKSILNFVNKHRKHTFSFGLNDPPQAQTYNDAKPSSASSRVSSRVVQTTDKNAYDLDDE